MAMTGIKKFKNIISNNDSVANSPLGKAGGTNMTIGQYISGNQPLVKSGGIGDYILKNVAKQPLPSTNGNATANTGASGSVTGGNAGLTSGALGAQEGANGVTPQVSVSPYSQNQPITPTIGSTIMKMAAEQKAKANGATGTQTGSGAVAESTPNQTPTSTPSTGVSGSGISAGSGSVAATVQGAQDGSQSMTLGEYIASLGVQHPGDTYRQAVQQANAQYDRSRAGYGAQAEALAEQGLTGSGTANYLDQAAYAQKQAAKSAAAYSRDQAMATYANGLTDYIRQQQEASQEKITNALNNALAMGLSTENTVKYLMATAGLTRTQAEQYAENTAGITSDNTLQEIAAAYDQLISGGAKAADAAAYLKSATGGGYDSALVDQVVSDKSLLSSGASYTNEQVGALQEVYATLIEERGYDPGVAKQYLLDSGYSADLVDAATAPYDNMQSGQTAAEQNEVYEKLNEAKEDYRKFAGLLGVELGEDGRSNTVYLYYALDALADSGQISAEQAESLQNYVIDDVIKDIVDDEDDAVSNLIGLAVNFDGSPKQAEVIEKVAEKIKVVHLGPNHATLEIGGYRGVVSMSTKKLSSREATEYDKTELFCENGKLYLGIVGNDFWGRKYVTYEVVNKVPSAFEKASGSVSFDDDVRESSYNAIYEILKAKATTISSYKNASEENGLAAGALHGVSYFTGE